MTRWREDSEETNDESSSEKSRGEMSPVSYRKFVKFSREMKNRFEDSQGFRLKDLTSFEGFVKLLYRPTDPASLGIVRALFGLCMVLDVVEERGFSDIDLKWGDPNACHFPLVHGMRPPSLAIMIVIYTIMWIGAFGTMLGFCFKTSCACFAIPYWYIFILDKSFWNNHTYLYGIVTILFWGTEANKYFALDAKLSKVKNPSVPLWNYFILKFQFFALYFIAGLKKSSKEWLEGYAMTNLSRHWVFDPFKNFLTTEQTDFLIVHWFGFIFDLSVGFFMLFPKTRIPAMVFCTAFHLMNSRLFSIGMFPFVCLATMPLFCNPDWPRTIKARFAGSTMQAETRLGAPRVHDAASGDSDVVEEEKKKKRRKEIPEDEKAVEEEGENNCEKDEKRCEARRQKVAGRKKCPRVTRGKKLVVALLLLHVALQFFLPYSHFVTKGYNNWVPGLYGYSWDMMVHAWEIILVVIKVHDNDNNEDLFMNPEAWVQNDRWAKHGDMVRQHARCIKDNLMRQKDRALRSPMRSSKEMEKWSGLSSNLSVYVDVWCSLNGRFQQRIFDPNVDMLKVDWHPLKPISYLMPLLTEFSSYRYKLDEIQNHVYTWSNFTDVLFFADYPGMRLENYISNDFTNVSLNVLEGSVTYAEYDWNDEIIVGKGDWVPIKTGKFHTITTTSSHPSCYMYTYTNQTEQEINMRGVPKGSKSKNKGLPIIRELNYKINAWLRVLGHIANSFFHLVYDVPMMRRVKNH